MKRHHWVVLATLFFCVSASFALSNSTNTPKAPELAVKRERRVIFDEDMQWATSREATDRIVERIVQAGFNVYIPCVWHGRGAHFPTSCAHIEPVLAKRIQSGDDPLGYLLQRAHARGIEVHPWFTVALRLDQRRPEFYSPETPANSYDVHNPEFRKFIVKLMVDMVRRYPVDGINLDYIRSVGTCQCATCTAEYRLRYGRSLADDAREAAKQGVRVATLESWHGEVVGAIVRELSAEVRAIRPGAVISVDGHPLASYVLAQGQDSVLWERNGWIDVIFSMDYRREIGVEEADRARVALADPQGFTILEITYDLVERAAVSPVDQWRVNGYVGSQAVLTRTPRTLADFVRLSRARWPGSGIAFYHYKQVTDAHIQELRSTVFRERVPASWPRRVMREGER